MSSPPTKSAPASCASRTFSPLARTRTRTLLPRPCGRTTVPRTTWSECFGSTPRLMEFHSFVKLRVMRLLDEFGRFTEFVRTRLDELARLLYVLTGFFQLCHSTALQRSLFARWFV